MANVVTVRKNLHQNIKIATKRGLEHIANQHIAPISAREYPKAGNNFPIFLVKHSGTRVGGNCTREIKAKQKLHNFNKFGFLLQTEIYQVIFGRIRSYETE